ncbi:MAG TPA: UvrD-helicase domain-containing protein [Longimicrobiales bacterium]
MQQLDLFGLTVTPQPAPLVWAPAGGAAELPDEAARRRIREDLDTSLLVEAGAGAGKTTAMVGRMVALIRTGRAQVQQIAAVTFTRKAASELRERFQTALESALRAARSADERDEEQRIDRALRDIDRAFLGTIHAFCARLLRERPLEAGLDPEFRETLAGEEIRQRRAFWNAHIDSLSAAGDESLLEVRAAGMEPGDLYNLFVELASEPDVDFPTEPRQRPRLDALRQSVEALMDQLAPHMPEQAPSKGWDPVQRVLRRLRFHRFIAGWPDDAAFVETISGLGADSFAMRADAWTDAEAVRRIRDSFKALFTQNGAATVLLHDWQEYRYPIAMSFARSAERAYASARLRAGTLNFQDLLMRAAALLQDSTTARRELGERYRYLLVDEFQDTDPVQAEVLFLLSSPPKDTDAGWWHVQPRPGALFVVGDPKQSIYRFRRADMGLYSQVRARFEGWGHEGAVVELTANFRSRQPIEQFVNQNFADRFPAEATETQAPYAPMRVQPDATPSPSQGVYWYESGTPHDRVPTLAREDARQVAAWIAERVASGDRTPGDFLIITPNTRWLAGYASALEARGVPAQVTGGRIVEQTELRELRLLLRALADPGDARLTVAVLTGLLYGIDYERLTTHVEVCKAAGIGNPFSFTREWSGPESDVAPALHTLREFWFWTRDLPADVAVTRIVERTGLLAFAASGELVHTRAGALLFALDAVRAAAVAGDASISGAIAALDAALEGDESEAPLEPGRTDVVRVMNLHKAKGLEAPVVILVQPFGTRVWPPTRRVVRDGERTARGYMLISKKDGDKDVVIARPPEWDAHAAAESAFAAAERDRLLYVAATRAAEELVIGVLEKPRSESMWNSFHGWLQAYARRLELPDTDPPAREVLHLAGSDIMTAVAAADAARATARTATYRAAPVTARKHELEASVEMDATALPPSTRLRGTEWGSVVHDTLEAAANGAAIDVLRSTARGLLIAAERPVAADGEPAELGELMGIVESVLQSDVWRRAQRAEIRQVEVPFALRLTAEDMSSIGATSAAPVEIIDGRIDLVFRDSGGWTIVDYKSDAAGSSIPAVLMARYREQVRLYAEAWQRLTGEAVAERVLLFTADGATVTA